MTPRGNRTDGTGFIAAHGGKLVALVVIAALFALAQQPRVSRTDRAALASRFHFTRAPLPEVAGVTPRIERPVHPSLAGISSWISSVGAAVALADIDGDGLPNDVVHVDTRTDQVVVSPVPGTGDRYAPFVLRPDSALNPLPYDSATMAPMGCLPSDLNEDGLTDLLVVYWGRTPVAFLRSDDPEPAPLSATLYKPCEVLAGGERWFTNAVCGADLDGDGHLDLIIGNYFHDGARILDAHAGGTEEMQASMSRAFNGGRKHFLLWTGAESGENPSVHFDDADAGLPHDVLCGWTLAASTADLDGDLLPEIYFANDFGPDRLLHNLSHPGTLRFALLHGKRHLTTPRSKVLGKDSFKGMGAEFADLNDDGNLDLFVSNITTEYGLQESQLAFLGTGAVDLIPKGIAPFREAGEKLGLGRSSWCWEARAGDFDNDGVLETMQATGFVKGEGNRWPVLQELAMGNDALLHHPTVWPRFHPGDELNGHPVLPFYVQNGHGRYVELSREIGLDDRQVSRGIATADVDGDGDLDWAVGNQWDTSYFYHNEAPRPGSFLGLRLLVPVKRGEPGQTAVLDGRPALPMRGRPAIGATVVVNLPGGGKRTAQVNGGNGHSGESSPDIHFGLGSLPADASVEVSVSYRDPDGTIGCTSLHLSPGWHTVLLGWPAEGAEGGARQ